MPLNPTAPTPEQIGAEACLLANVVAAWEGSAPTALLLYLDRMAERLSDIATIAHREADDAKRMAEQLDGQVRNYYAALGQGRIVTSRLDRGLIVINGGRAVLHDFAAAP